MYEFVCDSAAATAACRSNVQYILYMYSESTTLDKFHELISGIHTIQYSTQYSVHYMYRTKDYCTELLLLPLSSAGCGRTGTAIALDYVYNAIVIAQVCSSSCSFVCSIVRAPYICLSADGLVCH